MTAKQYLLRAYNLKRRIEAKEMHLEELRTQAEHITADLNGMPRGSGPSSPVERVAVQIADLSWELELDWLDLLQYQEETKRLIERLDNDADVQVMSLRYLSYLTWERIAEEVHYSGSQVYRIQVRAHRKIEQMINVWRRMNVYPCDMVTLRGVGQR
jgi:hypothetical protein